MIGLLNQAPVKDLNSFKAVGDALEVSSQNPLELVQQTQVMMLISNFALFIV